MFSELIKGLPEADIGFEGIKGWISQANDHQVVFMEIDAIGEVEEHSHGAQWGVVIKGEMELNIGGHTRTYRKGDSYFIPEKVPHSAIFNQKTYVIDYFADKNRYKAKK